jgi:hypothetical protein
MGLTVLLNLNTYGVNLFVQTEHKWDQCFWFGIDGYSVQNNQCNHLVVLFNDVILQGFYLFRFRQISCSIVSPLFAVRKRLYKRGDLS